jgi:hypothetical protein
MARISETIDPTAYDRWLNSGDPAEEPDEPEEESGEPQGDDFDPPDEPEVDWDYPGDCGWQP